MGYPNPGCQIRGVPSTTDASEYRLRAPEYRAMVEKLKQARREAGLTQAQAAERLGKLQSYVSKIERAERRIDPPELACFASAYGKPLEWFLS
jgi:DNA-binding XRE family transcriptional regulator